MRSSTEPTDTLGTFPAKRAEQTPAPAPAPVIRQISKHVREVNGRMETDDYPKPEAKTRIVKLAPPTEIYGKRFSGVIVDELAELPQQPQGLPCRYSAKVLDLLDALGC